MNKSASGFGLSAPGHQREVGATRADRAAGAKGLQNKDITEPLGIGRVQVARWRQRYLDWGLQGIERDLPRGAPPVKVDVARLVELTTQTTPEAATHWSTRKMGAANMHITTSATARALCLLRSTCWMLGSSAMPAAPHARRMAEVAAPD